MSREIYLTDGFWSAHEIWFDTDRVGQVVAAWEVARSDTARCNPPGRRHSPRSSPDATNWFHGAQTWCRRGNLPSVGTEGSWLCVAAVQVRWSKSYTVVDRLHMFLHIMLASQSIKMWQNRTQPAATHRGCRVTDLLSVLMEVQHQLCTNTYRHCISRPSQQWQIVVKLTLVVTLSVPHPCPQYASRLYHTVLQKFDTAGGNRCQTMSLVSLILVWRNLLVVSTDWRKTHSDTGQRESKQKAASFFLSEGNKKQRRLKSPIAMATTESVCADVQPWVILSTICGSVCLPCLGGVTVGLKLTVMSHLNKARAGNGGILWTFDWRPNKMALHL